MRYLRHLAAYICHICYIYSIDIYVPCMSNVIYVTHILHIYARIHARISAQYKKHNDI